MKPFSAILFFITTLSLFTVSSDYVFGSYKEQIPQTNTQFYKFRVHLKDKGHNEYTLKDPSQFLSQKSIERKKIQNVEVDERDFPISNDYFSLLQKVGGKVVSHSKWFKTIVVRVSDSLKINEISSLTFVDSVQYVWKGSVGNYDRSLRPRINQSITYENDSAETVFEQCNDQFKIGRASC